MGKLDFEEVVNEANRLFDESKYDQAEPLLLSLVKDSVKGYPDVYNKLGLIAHQKGDLRKAALYFERALQTNPRYTECSLSLAITYNDMGLFDEARDVFKRAMNIVQSSTETLDPYIRGRLANEHKKLGERYKDLGLYDEALDEFQKALKHRPNLVDIVTEIGVTLREKGRLDDSIRILMKAKEINSRYIPSIIQLGITYYAKGFSNLARTEWEEAQAIDPDGKEARVYLALARKNEI
ncbi:MAG TPA: tetratricopeptide repeat protein [Nitrospiria bacterium]|nr:tetratricopeptide repeat protein [Nitrospiria bacterium]